MKDLKKLLGRSTTQSTGMPSGQDLVNLMRQPAHSKVYTSIQKQMTKKIGEYLPVAEKFHLNKDGKVARAMPFLVPIIAWVATTFAVSTAIATSIVMGVVMSVISLGISLITRLIMGKPSASQQAITSQASVRQPISFWRVAYGQVQVGGVYTFIVATSTDGKQNNWLEPIITLTGHKIHALNTILFDGKAQVSASFTAWNASTTYHIGDLVTFNGGYYQCLATSTGNVPGLTGFFDVIFGSSTHWKSTGPNGNLLWEINLGDPFFQGQPFPQLVGTSNGFWDYRMRQQGRAGIHFGFQWDATQYPNGLPANIAFNYMGKEVYDPRNKVAFNHVSVTSTNYTLTACSDSPTATTTYTGTITGGASNALAGRAFQITGFTKAANNGTWQCVSSTATTVTLYNPNGVAETHAGVGNTNLLTLTGPGTSSSPAFQLMHDGYNPSHVMVEGLLSPHDDINGLYPVVSVSSGSMVLDVNRNFITGVALPYSVAALANTALAGYATQMRWSDNPAVCLLDYMMAGTYGMNVPLLDVDMSTVIAAANICDEPIFVRGSGPSPITLASVSAHDANGNAVYHGPSITGGGYNALVGLSFTVAGFTNSNNNGNFICTASNSTTLTLNNPLAAAETHAATATGIAKTEKRYTCNGVFDVSGNRADAVRALLQAMGGYLVAPGDSWRMYAAAYRTPTVTLTDDDFRDTLKYKGNTSRADLFNNVQGTYTSPTNQYVNSNYPPQPPPTNTTYQVQDGEPIWDDFQLDFTSSPTMAQRLARIHLERARRQGVLTAPCKLTAYQVQAGDVVEVTHDRFGWTNKTFEVLQVDLVASQGKAASAGTLPEADGLGVDLLLRETDGDIYTWDANVDENITDEPNVPLIPAAGSVDPVSGLFLLSDNTTMSTAIDGVNHARIFVSWDQHTDQFVQSGGFIEIYYKLSTDTTYISAGRAAGSDINHYISGVLEGKLYNVQAIAVNSHGAHSTPVTASVTVSASPSLNQSSGTAVTNSNFESSTAIIPPPGWQYVGSPIVSYDSITPYFGKGQSVLIVGAVGEGLQQVARTACLPGDEFKVSAAAKTDGTHSASASIIFYDKFDVPTGTVTAATTSAAWVTITAVGICPANTVNYAVSLLQASSGTNTVEFDQVSTIRIASSDEVPRAWTVVVIGHVDSPYTASGYQSINVDSSGGAVVINLPLASLDNPVQVFKISSDTNLVTVQPTVGTIDGVSSFSISEQGESFGAWPDGANYWID